jgi:hypothetical protein
MDASKIALLIDIADRALDVDNFERLRKEEVRRLTHAYEDWKYRNGTPRVERDSLQWVLMMHGTGAEYQRVLDAKRRERNSRKRLETAIRRYHAA